MTIKFSLLFQLATATSDPTRPVHRIGGWSENMYWYNVDNVAMLKQIRGDPDRPFLGVPGLAPARAGLLPVAASIVGVRYNVVKPAIGPSQSAALAFPGATLLAADIPQMALLATVNAVAASNVRRLILRAIPDARVTEGEFLPTLTYSTALLQYAAAIGAFAFRGRDLSQATFPFLGVDAAGAFETLQPHTWNVGDMVRVLRVMDSGDDLKGGIFKVATIGPTSSKGTFTAWNLGLTTGGSGRKDGVVYPTFDGSTFQVSRIIVKKVGRPFVGYRGRRSKKKK